MHKEEEAAEAKIPRLPWIRLESASREREVFSLGVALDTN
jgi:hypothetical protein